VAHHFVDIWYTKLSDGSEDGSLWSVLDEQERCKANSIKNERVRSQFILVRGSVRMILGKYLATEPMELKFETGHHGKPALIGGGVFFNISHSGSLLLIAVSDMAEIGVDIEQIKQRGSLDEMARRCFSEYEFKVWKASSLSEQEQVFYRLWTIKEAFVKSVGRGIALGLDRCEVNMADFAKFVSVPTGYGDAENWRISELFFEDYCGALVTPNLDFIRRDCPF
jgi:4'-phosphopantetheinyl transferase